MGEPGNTLCTQGILKRGRKVEDGREREINGGRGAVGMGRKREDSHRRFGWTQPPNPLVLSFSFCLSLPHCKNCSIRRSLMYCTFVLIPQFAFALFTRTRASFRSRSNSLKYLHLHYVTPVNILFVPLA